MISVWTEIDQEDKVACEYFRYEAWFATRTPGIYRIRLGGWEYKDESEAVKYRATVNRELRAKGSPARVWLNY